jgi:hypothetical protein
LQIRDGCPLDAANQKIHQLCAGFL